MLTMASHVSIARRTRSSRCLMAVCWNDAARSALIDSGSADLFGGRGDDGVGVGVGVRCGETILGHFYE